MPKKTRTLIVVGAIVLLGSLGALGAMRSVSTSSDPDRHTPRGIAQNLESQGLSIDHIQESGGAFSAQKSATFSIGGELITAFFYKTPAEATALAQQFSPDAQTLGGTPVEWVAPPHLYASKNAMILYIGTSPPIIESLTHLFGNQFAGR